MLIPMLIWWVLNCWLCNWYTSGTTSAELLGTLLLKMAFWWLHSANYIHYSLEQDLNLCLVFRECHALCMIVRSVHWWPTANQSLPVSISYLPLGATFLPSIHRPIQVPLFYLPSTGLSRCHLFTFHPQAYPGATFLPTQFIVYKLVLVILLSWC